ncbi:hypothetical protein SADUNF_Sadunf04G0141900 [Salix dunnii]|uniref:tryptophan--tRNA ligase n=1 Tax=Salix dunnii TaxID=1413687 RepID=A0A835K5N4_9ROSI|nr:hypothetical protein SADUNF_Sadunf04G0141900 [Salix dunnii]
MGSHRQRRRQNRLIQTHRQIRILLLAGYSMYQMRFFVAEWLAVVIECGSAVHAFAFYKNMVKVANCVTLKKVQGIFGFSGEDHIGKISFPPLQAIPSFPSSFPHLFSSKDNLCCLIPSAMDQDPYFRMTRDVAPWIGYHKPSLIELTFFPALQGETGKMSGSGPNSVIYVTDSSKVIKSKACSRKGDVLIHLLGWWKPINKYAFSGGQDSVQKHRQLGAHLEEYAAGRMPSGEVKNRLGQILAELVERHRAARASVTDKVVDAFMAVRPLPNMFD